MTMSTYVGLLRASRSNIHGHLLCSHLLSTYKLKHTYSLVPTHKCVFDCRKLTTGRAWHGQRNRSSIPSDRQTNVCSMVPESLADAISCRGPKFQKFSAISYLTDRSLNTGLKHMKKTMEIFVKQTGPLCTIF